MSFLVRYVREDHGGWNHRTIIYRPFSTLEGALEHIRTIKNLDQQNYTYKFFELFELVSIPIKEEYFVDS